MILEWLLEGIEVPLYWLSLDSACYFVCVLNANIAFETYLGF